MAAVTISASLAAPSVSARSRSASLSSSTCNGSRVALGSRSTLASRARVSLACRAQIAVGADAPDFTLMGAGFGTKSLSDFKGQKVVLAFFPAAFSGDADGGCQCQLSALTSINDLDGVTVLGISKDTPFTMGGWEEAQGWNFSCLSDMDLSVSKQYVGTFDLGSFLDDLDISSAFTGYETACRGCVVVDEAGKVVYSWVGKEDGKVHPGVLPEVSEIQAAVGMKKGSF